MKLVYKFYDVDIKELYKITSLLDPYLYINKEFVVRLYENYNFVKTKYKLYRIKELLNVSNINILQYQPFLSYFFQTYEEIIKFKLIDKNKSISILEITNLPNVFEACFYYEKNKKNSKNRSSYTVDLFVKYSNKNFLEVKQEYLEYYNLLIIKMI
jgi:hypothetical protein